MSSNGKKGHRLTRRVASVVVAALAASSAASVASIGIAGADSPAVPNVTTVATTSSQSNVAPNGPLTGLVNGSNIQVVVTASGTSAGKFFGFDARLCSGASNITNSAGFAPSQTGNCIDAPFNASSDDFQTASAATSNVTATINFRAGTGTRTMSTSLNGTQTVTCDSANPCRLWLKESFDTALVPSGVAWVHYDLQYASAPGTPTGVTATGGNQTVTVNWTVPTTGAPFDSQEVTLTGGATPVVHTVSGTATSDTFTGLTNFTTYSATVRAHNAIGFGPASSPAATATPGPGGPTNVSGVPGDHKVDLSWTAPAGPTPDSYQVVATPTNPAGADITMNTTTAATSFSFTGLTNGTVYTFKVRAKYGTNFGSFSASSAGITPNGILVTQTITVRRPQGALVLTQICGNHAARLGPPAIAGVSNGTAPAFGTGTDPLFPQYPYPEDANNEPTANYPTDCGIALGTASFIKSGPGAGQFYSAKGLLNQVTVVDTRDNDPGWNANGSMSTFTASTGTFGGGQLGWHPIKTSDTGAFTDANGNSYDQTVGAGPDVAPNTGGATGLGGTALLAHANSTQGLGIAVLDADLTLWIPVFAKTGNYTGTLTLTAV